MISGQDYTKPVNIKEFSLTKNSTLNRILVFIKESLIVFERAYKNSSLHLQREDDISEKLCIFFNDKAGLQNILFNFNAKVGVDFTIFVSPFNMDSQPIFMIEAKRLSKKHYDYVSGNNGGIERFKNEQFRFGQHLSSAAMIGYIQDEDKNYWYNKINDRIEDLIGSNSNLWNQNDKLVKEPIYSDFVSNHIRNSGSFISIFHYWIFLN